MAMVLRQRTGRHSVEKRRTVPAHRKRVSCRYKVVGHDHTIIEYSRGSSMSAIRTFF